MTNLLFNLTEGKTPEIHLIRDVSKHLKRGHRWIFADCFDRNDKSKGGVALLKSKNEVMGIGLVQPDTQLRFRMLSLSDENFFRAGNVLHTLSQWSEQQWKRV